MRKFLAAIATALGLILFALPAVAVDDINVPLTTVVRGAEGDAVVLAEVTTGSDVGCEAVVSATSTNNESVHIGNDLIVTSGGNSVTLSDVEATPLKVTYASSTLVLGDTVTVTLVLGQADEGRPNSIFSGGMMVTIACVAGETTTTTEATTTTTVDDTTTTTVDDTTTTTVDDTTTTTVDDTTTTTVDDTTTTTVDDTTTTTEEPTTTTTGPVTATIGPTTTMQALTTTTVPEVLPTIVSTTVPPVSASTLPFTGPSGLIGLTMAAGALLALGGAMAMSARKRSMI